MKYKILLVCSFFFLKHNGYGQSDSLMLIQKNVIKVPIVWSAVSAFSKVPNYYFLGIAYERVLNQKFTVNIAFDFGTFIRSESSNVVIPFGLVEKSFKRYRGFAVRPQFRTYIINNKFKFPRGAYIGGTVQFMRHNILYQYENYHYKYKKEESTHVNYYGLGGVAGVQWLFGKRISMDLCVSVYYNFMRWGTKNSEFIDKVKLAPIFPVFDWTIGYAFGKSMTIKTKNLRKPRYK